MHNILKSIIKEIIIGLLIITGGFTSYAIEVDTFNILQYKIKNHQLKKCLSDIAKEESGKLYQQVGLVVVNFSQGELLVDPPVWIFKKQKRKFILIDNDDYSYTPTALYFRLRKTNE